MVTEIRNKYALEYENNKLFEIGYFFPCIRG
jgi:hypothetical protein